MCLFGLLVIHTTKLYEITSTRGLRKGLVVSMSWINQDLWQFQFIALLYLHAFFTRTYPPYFLNKNVSVLLLGRLETTWIIFVHYYLPRSKVSICSNTPIKVLLPVRTTLSMGYQGDRYSVETAYGTVTYITWCQDRCHTQDVVHRCHRRVSLTPEV